MRWLLSEQEEIQEREEEETRAIYERIYLYQVRNSLIGV